MKRAFDLVGACSLLVGLGPLMLVVALAVRITSPGPALFRQTRVGHRNAPFRMLKFRTMYVETRDDVHRDYVTRLLRDGSGASGGVPGVYKLCDDPRITPIGALLRRTSIDELPQLLNVIRGEMSLVGPRPVLPWEAELFSAAQAVRCATKPGMTGLWQVRGRSALTMGEALELDQEYVRTWRLKRDFAILAQTIPTLVMSTLTGGGVR